MTIGASGSYAANGTNLTLQPTEGRWLERDSFGIDGGGHPVYSNVRNFELSWQLISPADFAQILGFYNQVQNTGTASADLPEWGANAFQFKSYSGCTMQEPTASAYFNEYIQEAKLLILNIRTS